MFTDKEGGDHKKDKKYRQVVPEQLTSPFYHDQFLDERQCGEEHHGYVRRYNERSYSCHVYSITLIYLFFQSSSCKNPPA